MDKVLQQAINGNTEVPVIALAAMGQLLDNSHSTYQNLVESYRQSLAKEQATLELVREGVERVLGGPYMPTPDTILGLLYPSSGKVDYRTKHILERNEV